MPIVILVAAGMTAAIWWQGTRKYDFLVVPTEAELAAVKKEAAEAYKPETPADTPEPPKTDKSDVATEPAPEPPKEPVLELGNLETSPGLQAYAIESTQGTDHLIKVATELEVRGAFQRALLAWERVIDLGKPEPEAYAAALASVKRLRPTLPAWNIDPEGAVPMVLHAASGPDTSAQLKPVLEAIARDLSVASAGIVNVTPEISVGKKLPNATAPAPIALWISGAAKGAPSSDVISFTVGKPEALRTQVLSSVYGLFTGQLKRSTAYGPLPALSTDEDPLTALTYRVTRLCWRELAAGLNLAPTPPPAPAPAAPKPRRNSR